MKEQRIQFMQIRLSDARVLSVALVAVLAGCASTYGNLVSGSKLGAEQYQPAVLATTPEQQAGYQKMLSICRGVAAHRQVTAAERAQLETITGVSEGAVNGLSMGIGIGGTLKASGVDTSINRDAEYGVLAGALGSLGNAFANGTERDASETRRVLLNCLRMGENQFGYRVVE